MATSAPVCQSCGVKVFGRQKKCKKCKNSINYQTIKKYKIAAQKGKKCIKCTRKLSIEEKDNVHCKNCRQKRAMDAKNERMAEKAAVDEYSLDIGKIMQEFERFEKINTDDSNNEKIQQNQLKMSNQQKGILLDVLDDENIGNALENTYKTAPNNGSNPDIFLAQLIAQVYKNNENGYKEFVANIAYIDHIQHENNQYNNQHQFVKNFQKSFLNDNNDN